MSEPPNERDRQMKPRAKRQIKRDEAGAKRQVSARGKRKPEKGVAPGAGARKDPPH